jgi:hypothetical protein
MWGIVRRPRVLVCPEKSGRLPSPVQLLFRRSGGHLVLFDQVAKIGFPGAGQDGGPCLVGCLLTSG